MGPARMTVRRRSDTAGQERCEQGDHKKKGAMANHDPLCFRTDKHRLDGLRQEGR